MGYTFDFSVVWDNLGLFFSGAIVTVRLLLIAIAFGLAIGIIGALCRTSGNRLLNGLAATYVELIRNTPTPFLIQLFFIFFGLPNLGLKLTAEQAATLALAVNFGAYSTEIVRAGVESIHKGQLEVGLALGFKPISVFRHIVITPALANIYPALVGQVILAVLFTSVVSQIATEDLTFTGDYLNARTFRSFEIYFTIALVYGCDRLVNQRDCLRSRKKNTSSLPSIEGSNNGRIYNRNYFYKLTDSYQVNVNIIRDRFYLWWTNWFSSNVDANLPE